MKTKQQKNDEPIIKYFIEGQQDEDNLFKLSTKDKNIQFCGFFLSNVEDQAGAKKEEPVVIFPKNYPIADNKDFVSIKTAAKLLLDTFRYYRYRRDNTSGWRKRATGTDKEILAVSIKIDNILAILEDFKENGYLHRKHRVISQTKPGRIMWNKTIQKSESVISHRQIFYPTPYMVSNVRHDEEMVQKIHRHLVWKLVKDWGWLTDISVNLPEEAEPCSVKEAKRILIQELSNCFIQREIDLLRRMINYYENQGNENANPKEDFLLTGEFEQIWENVCSYVLHNDYNQLKDDIPKANYEGIGEIKPWSQIPDILCQPNKKLYILDAKYYAFPEKQPGWGDMCKQFVYAFSLSHVAENGKTKFDIKANALLFPGNEKVTVDKPWKYYGEAKFEELPEFGKVQLWSLNVKDMLEAYVGKKNFPVAEFFKELEKIGCSCESVE